MDDPAGTAPLLLPRPRGLTLNGGCVPVPSLSGEFVRTEPGASLSPEGYRLTVAATGGGPPVRIEASCDAGARHGTRTLRQLIAQYGAHIPACTIDDAPAFPTRGVMLDISRDRVPTMEHLLQTVERLSSLKFNHLQLYTEHTFAYAGHEEVWRDASPVTPAEIRELDASCRERGVDLAANQNCFGHLAGWLRHARYAPLAETHGEWFFENAEHRFPRRGPFSLCPTDPASVAFVEDLLGQLLPCFSGGLVNIGCDETFDVGFGRSRDEVSRRGRCEVYLDFVTKIASIARGHGRRPMFWGDIALSHPESLARIPEDMIALAWGYEPGEPWARWCEQLRAAGRDVWVCPGTSSWRSITGRTSERRANLGAAAQQGSAAGASGFLVTDWGDCGHHQPWPISLAALAEAADAAWTGGRAGYDARAASLHAFGDRSLGVADWLDSLGDADAPLRRICGRPAPDGSPRPLRNASALFADLHMPLCPEANDDSALRKGLLRTPGAFWRHVLDRLRSLEAEPAWAAAADFRDELRHTLDLALCAADRAVLRRSGDLDTSRREFGARLADIMDEHRRLWLRRSRPGGLDASCRHYQRIIDDLRGAGP